MEYSRQRGVSLMELLVAVAIVAILAGIAYPSYINQVRKSQRADGTKALLNYAQQLKRCRTDFYAYDHDEKNFPRMVKAVETLAGKRPSGFQGRYSFKRTPFRVPFSFDDVETR